MNFKKYLATLLALSAVTSCTFSPTATYAESIKNDIIDAQVQKIDDNSFNTVDNDFIQGVVSINNAPPFAVYDIYKDYGDDGLFNDSDEFIESISCDALGNAYTNGLENGNYFLLISNNNGYLTDDMYYFSVSENTPAIIQSQYQDIISDNSVSSQQDNPADYTPFSSIKTQATDTSTYLQSILWKVPMYKQSGPLATDWSSLLVNGCPGQTMGYVGCTITSFSMLYSFENNSATTPKDMMNMVTFAGSYGTTASMNVAQSATKFGWTIDGTVANGSLTDNLRKIYNHIKNGNPVIVCGYSGESASNSAHWIVVTGYTGDGINFRPCDFLINDPANTTKSNNLEQFLALKPKWSRLVYSPTPKTNAFSVIGGSPNTTLTILNDLNANGSYDEGDTIYKKVQTDKNGSIAIKDLPVGNYLLTKTSDDLPAHYGLKSPYYSFAITNTQPASLKIEYSIANGNAKVIDAPPNAALTLYSDTNRDGLYENSVPVNSDKNGIITLPSLITGSYKLTKNVDDAPVGYITEDCYFNISYGTDINVVMKTYAPGNAKLQFKLSDGNNKFLDKNSYSSEYEKLSTVSFALKNNESGRNISANLAINEKTGKYEYTYSKSIDAPTYLKVPSNSPDLIINNLPKGSYTITLLNNSIDNYQATASSYIFNVDSRITSNAPIVFTPSTTTLKMNITPLTNVQPSDIKNTTFNIQTSSGSFVTAIEKSNSYQYKGTTALNNPSQFPLLGSAGETSVFHSVVNQNGDFYIDVKGLPEGTYNIIIHSTIDGYRTIDTKTVVVINKNTVSSTSLLLLASNSTVKSVGDINNNGTVSIDDLMKILNYCIDNSSLNFKERLYADIDGNCTINTQDMILLSKIIANKN